MYPRIAEYGQVRQNGWPVSTPEFLDKRTIDGREYTLVHLPAGYEPAGSAMRYLDHEVWAVWFYLDGARHGKRFSDYPHAIEHFFNVTS